MKRYRLNWERLNASEERDRTTGIAGEGGFALPFTIFLVTIITIMLAAAFTRTTAEHMLAGNSAAEVSALALAQSGLQQYLANPPSERPGTEDSVRFNYPGGYAWVHPELVYFPEDTSNGFTYVLRSAGYVVYPSVGSEPQASRTIAQFARWYTAQLPTVAAFAAINGIGHPTSGNPGHDIEFYGVDDCAPTAPDIWAARTPLTSTDLSTTPHFPGGGEQRTGTAAEVADELGIDWSAIVNDGVVEPDYPSPVNGDMTFPTYVITGDHTFGNFTGSGLLIVTGDLYLTGNLDWQGILLIGGRIIPNSVTNAIFYGAVLTGLNGMIGPTPGPNPFEGPGFDLTFQYRSCNIEDAMSKFGGFQSVPNAWVDNWATY